MFTNYNIRELNTEEKQSSLLVRGYATTWDDEYPVYDMLEGYGYVPYMESFVRGAFAKSITARCGKDKKNAIQMLYQHNSEKVIGTPTLVEDDKGLFFEVEVFNDFELGKEVVSHITHGNLKQLSIGFREKDYDITKDENETIHCQHKEVYLREFSLVTWGANENALIEKNRSNIGIINLINEYGAEKVRSIIDAMTNTTKENDKKVEEGTEKLFVFSPLVRL